jgi:hypothetical protein
MITSAFQRVILLQNHKIKYESLSMVIIKIIFTVCMFLERPFWIFVNFFAFLYLVI